MVYHFNADNLIYCMRMLQLRDRESLNESSRIAATELLFLNIFISLCWQLFDIEWTANIKSICHIVWQAFKLNTLCVSNYG